MKRILLLFLFVFLLLSGCGTTARTGYGLPPASATAFETLPVMGTAEWKDYARQHRINLRRATSRQPVTVLGHYPEYVELTEKIGAESMQVPMEHWNAMTPEKQWETTTGYFDRKIESRHHFRLATPVDKARAGSYYVRELNYLFGRGYRLSPDGLWLVR